MVDMLNLIDADDFGDTEFVATERRYRNADASAGHGRVASAAQHFTLASAIGLRERQDASRAAERSAGKAKRRTQRSGRSVKYLPGDEALVSAIWTMTTSD